MLENVHRRAIWAKKLTKTKETRDHKFGTVANGVYRAVLDDNTLVGRKKTLQRANDPPQVRLVALVVIQPLGVHNIMQGDHAVVLVHGSTAHATELLHVRANAKQETKVDTQSPNVRSCLTADPENTQMSVIVELKEFALVDGPNTELALNGGDQRRPLEKSTGQAFQSAAKLSLATRNLVVKTDHANILLSCALLRLDQTSRTVNADDQASRDLRVESSAVTSFLGPL